jgi:hypothetical protein
LKDSRHARLKAYQSARSGISGRQIEHWLKVKNLKHPTMSRVMEGVLVTRSRS